MGLLQDIENFQTTTTTNLESQVSTGRTSVQGILDDACDSLSGFDVFSYVGAVFTGGKPEDALIDVFAGMSMGEIDTLIGDSGAIEGYCSALDDIVESFNENKVDAKDAFKGQIKTEVENFVEGTKQLIYAYISNLRQFRKDIDQYRKAYKAAVDEDIAGDVKQGVEEINRNAQTIKFDEFGPRGN